MGSLDSHRFLATEAFLELLPEWGEKQRPLAPREPSNVQAPNGEHAREASAIAYVLAQLADTDLSEDYKQRIRARWTLGHPENPAPWVTT